MYELISYNAKANINSKVFFKETKLGILIDLHI